MIFSSPWMMEMFLCLLFWTDHSIILHRLHHDFGIQGTALDWFSSYFTNRTQSVSIHCYTSEPAPIFFGVPQGLVLGPVLFVLYTPSLSTVIEKHSVLHHSYADHSQLQKSATLHQIPDLFLSMQKCIDEIKSWMTLNKLKLNDDKTEAMITFSGRKSRSLSFSFPDMITVGCASVSLSDSVKNLGVTLDCHLTMKTHVSNLVHSVNSDLCYISSIHHLLCIDATKTLVSAFVLSHLDYCNSSFWMSSVSPKQTTEGSEQRCSPCSKSF